MEGSAQRATHVYTFTAGQALQFDPVRGRRVFVETCGIGSSRKIAGLGSPIL